MPRTRRALTALAALLLGGCYVSKTPLITPATADYPVADGTHFDAFAPRGKDWRADQGRLVRRAGDYYVYSRDGRTTRSLPFLFKRVRGDFYVVQMSDTATGEYGYELFEFDGRTAIQHRGTCNPRQVWLDGGLIDRVEDATERRCVFSDFDKLARVLLEAAVNAAPEAKYTASVKAPASP